VRVIIALMLVVLASVAHAERPRVERGYRNGKPVRIKVVQIGWADVEVETAKAFRKMEKAARRAGVDLEIRSGFRSHARQKELYRAWRDGYGNKAARPGFSNHQSGRALDISMTDAVREWMRSHARRFGFRQTVRGEPWHWEFSPVRIARASSTRRRS
jgi:LAS superfamily LD-carboxypeptidase LdcB